MKSYLADILTALRLVFALILLVMCFLPAPSVAAAFCLFMLGELTDAFDGTLATKYPFPKSKTPKYRKYASRYDMWIDTLLGAAACLFFINHINTVVGLAIGVTFSVLAILLDLLVYGKTFGHPDNARPHSLMRRNFPLARRLVLARRCLYLLAMAVIAIWTLYASEWPQAVKIAITTLCLFATVFLWFFLAQRRHHISRDAVDIEEKLSK